MFGRMMNNYYYGKSGKGDFRKEDLPETRMQLFRDTLKTRLSALCRLNLLYVLIWLPVMILIYIYAGKFFASLNNIALYSSTYARYEQWAQNNQIDPMEPEEFNSNAIRIAILSRDYQRYAEIAGDELEISEEEFNQQTAGWPTLVDQIDHDVGITTFFLLLIAAIGITGPFTAGVSYVTRNWARDEHAFIWSDFKDAVKANWKIPLVISIITGILPGAMYAGWIQYGQMTQTIGMVMIVPQVLVIIIGIIWSLSVTYMHPLTVTYELKLKDVIKDGLILGIARLPFSVGIRLLHCVPVLIYAAAFWFFGLDPMLGLMILGAYYILIGFALSRFVTASYTNAVFDRFINQRIDGAKVNQGMKEPEDDEYDEEEPDQTAGESGKD